MAALATRVEQDRARAMEEIDQEHAAQEAATAAREAATAAREAWNDATMPNWYNGLEAVAIEAEAAADSAEAEAATADDLVTRAEANLLRES